MDNFDRQILNLIQINNHKSSEEIGNEIGLSATSVQRRLKKLRSSGIINKEIAVLDGITLGGFVTVIVEVVMERGGAHVINNFKKEMSSYQEVQQCYYVAGNSDFILVITAENMLKYEKLTHLLFLNNKNIAKFHSTVVMENVKTGLNIPIKFDG